MSPFIRYLNKKYAIIMQSQKQKLFHAHGIKVVPVNFNNQKTIRYCVVTEVKYNVTISDLKSFARLMFLGVNRYFQRWSLLCR